MTGQPILRPITQDEFPAFAACLLNAFGDSTHTEEVAAHELALLELDRTVAAADGADVVGTAAIYSYELTVPGRTVPAAGVTWVSVLPTHRRRGLLRQLMRRQLDDVHEAGREPVAILWASEAPIYGRFGYGVASEAYSLTVPRVANALRPVPGADDVRVRLVDGTATLDATIGVYDHDRARRPGMVALSGPWRSRGLFWPEPFRRGATELRTVLAEDPAGAVRGYARYATRPGEDFGRATTVVRELHAVDAAAYAALLRYLLDLDLTAKTSMWLRPPDDPVLQLLMDPRPAEVSRGDGLYARLVDVPAALAARTYAVPIDVVLDVTDPFCPWNAGRWRLSGDPTGATCAATTDAADLAVDVRELGATYLGGGSLGAAFDAGLVQEHTPGGVALLSAALHHEPAPWHPFIF